MHVYARLLIFSYNAFVRNSFLNLFKFALDSALDIDRLISNLVSQVEFLFCLVHVLRLVRVLRII